MKTKFFKQQIQRNAKKLFVNNASYLSMKFSNYYKQLAMFLQANSSEQFFPGGDFKNLYFFH